MALGFFEGSQWTPEQLKTMELRAEAKKGLGAWMMNKLDDAMMKVVVDEPEPLYTDASGGFQFTTHNWTIILKQGERERFYGDAVKHRDEAIRRMVETRLDGRPKEADHWEACYRFLENSFRIPPHD